MFFSRLFKNSHKKREVESEVDPYKDQTSIGNVLINSGFLEREQFEALLAEFQELRIEMLIGQYLLSQRAVTPEQLDFALIKQENMRTGGTDPKLMMQALEVASRTQASITRESEGFAEVVQLGMLKVNGSKIK